MHDIFTKNIGEKIQFFTSKLKNILEKLTNFCQDIFILAKIPNYLQHGFECALLKYAPFVNMRNIKKDVLKRSMILC